ncbi:pectinesterase-like [Mercurialis annua]|uniref:pectinesterase-like n=1 Tax=Mercurialis annua TaxID=3986 RepID=UPI0021600275|nr:pectinesterase-like [Mercurialis annua]
MAFIFKIFKNSENPTTITPKKTVTLIIIFFTLTILILASFLKGFSLVSNGNVQEQEFTHSSTPNLIVNLACTRTLYPSLCLKTLSSIQIPKNSATFGHILEFTINETEKSVATARKHVTGLLGFQDLISQEKIALRDCLEMLDQTRYELGQAPDDLQVFSASNLKTLLSAAMTNQHTCIDGFSDLDRSDFKNQKGLKSKIQDLFSPITGMISNCLSIITYMESVTDEDIKTVQERKKFVKWFPRNRFHPRMGSNIRPNIVVARDGSGNCSLIGEAIEMAPNGSRHRFVIKIKAGVYNETVNVPREKTNIMLIGDGMSRTVITGSKNFVDGFSTFDSATLTVAGDRFLARDLTIINTSGPYKFQAVAARVTSNSAFYRCNFSSYQDTLFAHSLRQFYRECTIQGTIDFIFGNAAAIFQHCLIRVRVPIPGQRNMITAQGRRDPNQNTGFSFQNCTITAAADLNARKGQNISTFLGRPWGNYSRTMLMNSYLGKLIHPQGWYKWDNYSTLDTVQYIEHLNYGPGSSTRYRVSWRGFTKNCSEDIVKQFTVGRFLHEADNWFESTGFTAS